MAKNWPSAGLQAGPGYLYYDWLDDGPSSAQRLNLTCPLADWPAALAAAGATLAPCGTATVASGEELLAALDALQPGHERVVITLAANATLPRRATGPVALVRNVTIVGGAGGRPTELDVRRQRDVLELPESPSGSCLHMADLTLVNLPAGEPATWPAGLLSSARWFFVKLNEPTPGTGATPRMFGLRMTQVMHPSTAQYLDYWTSRQASVFGGDRRESAWLDPLISTIAMVYDEDGSPTAQQVFGTSCVGYGFRYTNVPLLTVPNIPAVNLWELSSPPVVLTDVRVLGAAADATADAVGRQLLQELQVGSPLPRTLLLAANASLSSLWWPSAAVPVAAPVTVAGPSAWPVVLDAGGVALSTTGALLTLRSLTLAGLRPPEAAAAGQQALSALEAGGSGSSGSADAIRDWEEACGEAPGATDAGGGSSSADAAVANVAPLQAMRCVLLLPSSMVLAMYRVAAGTGAGEESDARQEPEVALMRGLLDPPQAVVAISPRICVVPGATQLGGLKLTNCTVSTLDGGSGAAGGSDGNTTTSPALLCTYSGMWLAALSSSQQPAQPLAAGASSGSSGGSSLSTGAVIGLAVMGAFCGIFVLAGAAFGVLVIVQRRRHLAAAAAAASGPKPLEALDAAEQGAAEAAAREAAGLAPCPGMPGTPDATAHHSVSLCLAQPSATSPPVPADSGAVQQQQCDGKAVLRVLDLAAATQHRPPTAPEAGLEAGAGQSGGKGVQRSATHTEELATHSGHHDYRARLGSLVDDMRTTLQQHQQPRPGQLAAQQPCGEAQLHAVVGQGSYGVVFKGLWRGLEVAVKVVLLPACVGQLQRRRQLLAEVDNSTRLAHPNIVAVYAFQIHRLAPCLPLNSRLLQTCPSLSATADQELMDDGNGEQAASVPRRAAWGACVGDPESDYKLAIIMQYCEGGNLEDAIQGGRFKLQDGDTDMVSVLVACHDIASGLAYLHGRGIVHLDLKSSNVLLKHLLPSGRAQARPSSAAASVRPQRVQLQLQQEERFLNAPRQRQLLQLHAHSPPPSPQQQQLLQAPESGRAIGHLLPNDTEEAQDSAKLVATAEGAFAGQPADPTIEVVEGDEQQPGRQQQLGQNLCWSADAHPRVVQRPLAAAPSFICKLADFGMSVDLGRCSGQTLDHGMQGTRLYAAPEQLVGQLSPACDVYSLGLVLWELVNGMTLRSLYAAEPCMTGHPGAEALLARVPPCVSEGVRALMADCLSADPAQRPSARQAQQALQAGVQALVGETHPMLGDARTEGDTGKVV